MPRTPSPEIQRRNKEIKKKRKAGWPIFLIANYYNLTSQRIVAILKEKNK